jgi:hypothetical protein
LLVHGKSTYLFFTEHPWINYSSRRDTVSSIGIARGPSLPETTTGMHHVCVFRHALALDERRVKFLPEYANGGLGPIVKSDKASTKKSNVKEVWFAGTHSDMQVVFICDCMLYELTSRICSGGGNVVNMELSKFGPALRWMTYEAITHGLLIEPFTGIWKQASYTESMKGIWKLLEFLPLRQLSYIDKDSTTRMSVS